MQNISIIHSCGNQGLLWVLPLFFFLCHQARQPVASLHRPSLSEVQSWDIHEDATKIRMASNISEWGARSCWPFVSTLCWKTHPSLPCASLPPHPSLGICQDTECVQPASPHGNCSLASTHTWVSGSQVQPVITFAFWWNCGVWSFTELRSFECVCGKQGKPQVDNFN